MSHGSDTAACDVPAVPTKIPAASATVAPADSSAFIKCRSRDRRITVNLFRSCGGVTRMPEGPGLDREFRARTTVACSEEHAARTSTSQAATNSSSVSANNSVNQVERMLASECVGALEQRDAITMAPVRSYVKVSGGVMCERTHTVGRLTTAITGSPPQPRDHLMAIPGIGQIVLRKFVQKRSVEGAVTARGPGRAVAGAPATPADTSPSHLPILTLTPADTSPSSRPRQAPKIRTCP